MQRGCRKVPSESRPPPLLPRTSFGDVVRADANGPGGQLQFTAVVVPYEFTSISVIVLEPAMDSLLMDLLRGLGCAIESGEFGACRALAVAVPSSADYGSLRASLTLLEQEAKLSFAELTVAHRPDPPHASQARMHGP